jgi:nucleoside-diphosphate-sugar epimerase
LQPARRLVAFSSTSATAYSESPDPSERRLAQQLCQAEGSLRQEADLLGLGLTILRPTIIYGGGSEGGLAAIVRLAERFGFVPIAAPARGLRQPVHTDDLAAAAVAVLDCTAAIGETFEIGGGEILSYWDMVERLIRLANRPSHILPVPAPLLRLGFGLLGKRLLGFGSPGAIDRMNTDQAFSIQPAKQAFNYSPRPFLPKKEDLFHQEPVSTAAPLPQDASTDIGHRRIHQENAAQFIDRNLTQAPMPKLAIG